ncbi:MAG: hypothetical protein IIA12_01165, partial [Proteobacteria bacterium]|nr:hypothetical protein [Pseudomonadota bacterium]
MTAILSPDTDALARYRRVMEMAADRILPPQLRDRGLVEISSTGSLLTAVYGRREQVLTHDFGILAGVVSGFEAGQPDLWWTVDGLVPDGSFMLIRGDSDTLVAITDYAGSRSVWHARLDCGGIVVSTCLELIVSLLGKFTFDDRALGWFLSSGTVGPRRSWDKKIKPLLRDSCLRARRSDAGVSVQVSKVERESVSLPSYDADKLREELLAALADFSIGSEPWLLALSGGYDSRAILAGTGHIEDLRCVTWIDEDCSGNGDSDVDIACRLAAAAGRDHEVKTIRRPTSAADLELALRRFVRYSDGRVDNILAYVDGMAIWDEMSAGEPGRLFRGDELFGTSIALQESRIRHNMNLDCFHDFASSPAQRDLAGRYSHEIPRSMLQKSGESVSHWRLRLRADFELPSVYAALNNLRSRFLESCCPLLDRRLVQVAASIEGHKLDERVLYTQAVATMYPDIPIAMRRSTLDQETFLRFPQVVELLQGHLEQDFAREALGSRCVQAAYASIREHYQLAETAGAEIDGAKVRGRSVPLWLKRFKRKMDSPLQLDMALVALRSYLAMLVTEEMSEAANFGLGVYEKH